MKRIFAITLAILITLAPTAYMTDTDPPPTDPPQTDGSVTGIIAEGLDQPLTTAQSAIVVEMNSGVTLYEKNSAEPRPMASLTKIMTVLLALESDIPLTREVTAKATALADMPADGSTANIKEGEILTLEDLLYCIMIASANEACNVVAEEVAGSIPEFVRAMNNKAKSLGCVSTNFMNTHGLHEDGHYSTAYDMFLITREAMKHPVFMTLANTVSRAVPPTNMSSKERSLLTTNYLISAKTQEGYTYQYAQGIKTGHHSAAGYCLISSAECDGLSLVTVVMGAQKDSKGKIHSFIDTKNLCEWAFDTYEFRTILQTKEIIDEVPVAMGKDRDGVNAVPSESLRVLLPKRLKTENIRREYEVGNAEAPIRKGQSLGEIKLFYKNHVFGTVSLVSDQELPRDEGAYIATQIGETAKNPWIRRVAIGIGGIIVLYVIFSLIRMAIRNRRRRDRGNRGNYRGKR